MVRSSEVPSCFASRPAPQPILAFVPHQSSIRSMVVKSAREAVAHHLRRRRSGCRRTRAEPSGLPTHAEGGPGRAVTARSRRVSRNTPTTLEIPSPRSHGRRTLPDRQTQTANSSRTPRAIPSSTPVDVPEQSRVLMRRRRERIHGARPRPPREMSQARRSGRVGGVGVGDPPPAASARSSGPNGLGARAGPFSFAVGRRCLSTLGNISRGDTEVDLVGYIERPVENGHAQQRRDGFGRSPDERSLANMKPERLVVTHSGPGLALSSASAMTAHSRAIRRDPVRGRFSGGNQEHTASGVKESTWRSVTTRSLPERCPQLSAHTIDEAQVFVTSHRPFMRNCAIEDAKLPLPQ